MERNGMKAFGILISLLLLIGLIGCGGEPPLKKSAANEKQEQTAAYPVTIKDSTGTDITIPKEPKRIISIVPSSTEIAFALGFGDKIVGVSDWDNYPEEVKKIEKIGGLDVSVEKVISLQPDLILANSSNEKSIECSAAVKILEIEKERIFR